MRIVEADKPRAVRCMEGERICQSVWALLRRGDPLDLELDPIAGFRNSNP
jgi:hypothetical protein